MKYRMLAIAVAGLLGLIIFPSAAFAAPSPSNQPGDTPAKVGIVQIQVPEAQADQSVPPDQAGQPGQPPKDAGPGDKTGKPGESQDGQPGKPGESGEPGQPARPAITQCIPAAALGVNNSSIANRRVSSPFQASAVDKLGAIGEIVRGIEEAFQVGGQRENSGADIQQLIAGAIAPHLANSLVLERKAVLESQVDSASPASDELTASRSIAQAFRDDVRLASSGDQRKLSRLARQAQVNLFANTGSPRACGTCTVVSATADGESILKCNNRTAARRKQSDVLVQQIADLIAQLCETNADACTKTIIGNNPGQRIAPVASPNRGAQPGAQPGNQPGVQPPKQRGNQRNQKGNQRGNQQQPGTKGAAPNQNQVPPGGPVGIGGAPPATGNGALPPQATLSESFAQTILEDLPNVEIVPA